MRYFVAVKIESNCDVFVFNSAEDRQKFIDDLIKCNVEYATSECL